MSHAVEQIAKRLADDPTISEAEILVREVRLRLVEIQDEEVVIRIYRQIPSAAGPFTWWSSHSVKAPGTPGAYITSMRRAATEEEAFDLALREFNSAIDWGKRDGHVPDASWLQPRERF